MTERNAAASVSQQLQLHIQIYKSDIGKNHSKIASDEFQNCNQ